jgi:hypothetical protein
MVTSSKIYRPAFKTCSTPRDYITPENRWYTPDGFSMSPTA